MKDRIANLIKSERLTSQQFAELVDMQSSTISHILAGRNSPSFRIIYGILEAFPMVNPDWLILGKGDMYRTPVSPEIGVINHNQDELFPDEPATDTEDNLTDDMPYISIVTNVNNTEAEAHDETIIEPIKQEQDVIKQSNSSPMCQVSNNEVKTDKIIVMYSDNTFEIYNPR